LTKKKLRVALFVDKSTINGLRQFSCGLVHSL